MSFTDSLSSSTGFNPKAYLAKFGYSDGKGLGKKEDGMTKHIAVNKKDDAKGIGAHEDYTKSFETLFNQAAKGTGAIKPGITFFDSDDEGEPAATVKEEPEEDEETARKQRKEEKKRKKAEKKAKAAAADSDDDDEEDRRKRVKLEPSPESASSPSASPTAAAPSQPRVLPPSSIHFIQFNMGSKLLADSHAEVDMKGQQLRKAGLEGQYEPMKREEAEAVEAGQPEMKYISESKPRPAASSIPKAKENATLKHGAKVKEQNGDHLYHDRSQGKMRRLEEADRAFIESMRARQNGSTPSSSPIHSSSPPKSDNAVGAFTSPLFAAPSPSPSPAPSTPMDESKEETEEERKARKAAKKAKKEAKRRTAVE